jgi:type II secretion system protein C
MVVGVTVVAGVFVGLFLVREGWLSGERRQAQASTQQKPNTLKPSDPTLAHWARQMEEGASNKDAPPAPGGTDSSISKVSLPLKLTVTRLGRNAREGTADIGVNEHSPQTYVAGAILANGARLIEIYPDHVRLEKDHRVVALYRDGRTRSNAQAAALSDLLTVGGTQTPPARADSHEELTDYIRPSPVYSGTAVVGFQVYPGRQAGIFGQMGLLPGDVITAIDDIPLSDQPTAADQLNRLTQGEVVSATVQRKGEQISVNLDGSIIEAARQQQAAISTTPLAQAAVP